MAPAGSPSAGTRPLTLAEAVEVPTELACTKRKLEDASKDGEKKARSAASYKGKFYAVNRSAAFFELDAALLENAFRVAMQGWIQLSPTLAAAWTSFYAQFRHNILNDARDGLCELSQDRLRQAFANLGGNLAALEAEYQANLQANEGAQAP